MIRYRKVGCSILALVCLTCDGSAFGQFETRMSVPVVQSPNSIAVGDFNQDGTLDLAVVGFQSNQVAVLLGNGDGTFQPEVNYDVGNVPASVATADFNHDGKLDLAVASSQGVSVLLGNGDGTFQAANTSNTTPNPPTYVAVGDFNRDHNLDLVVIDFHQISVLLGNGDGTFQPAINTTATYAPGAIGVDDFNGDGKLDVVAGEQFGGISQAEILLGNGDGTFSLGANYAIGAEPTSVAVADLNRDKKLDLVVSSLGDGTDVLLGNGDGTFQQAVEYREGVSWVTVADFNGDGNLDLASAQLDFPSGVFVRPGNGKGAFGDFTYYSDGKEDRFVAAGDFNGDGKPDLVVADYFANSVIVLLNTGVVRFSPSTPLKFAAQLIGTTSAPQTVSLTNTGKTALAISDMKVNGDFNLSTTCGSSVAPGANCALTVTFQPQTKGADGGTVRLTDSASSKPQVIELQGVGTVVSVSPTRLDFGSQKVGTRSAAQPVTVTNLGSTTLTFSGIKILGALQDYFQANTCGSQLLAGASCTIAVTFAPTKTGKRRAQISISDDGGASPQIVLLAGTGI